MERTITIKTDGAYCGDDTGECPYVSRNDNATHSCLLFGAHPLLLKPPKGKGGFLRSDICAKHFGEQQLVQAEEERTERLLFDKR